VSYTKIPIGHVLQFVCRMINGSFIITMSRMMRTGSYSDRCHSDKRCSDKRYSDSSLTPTLTHLRSAHVWSTADWQKFAIKRKYCMHYRPSCWNSACRNSTCRNRNCLTRMTYVGWTSNTVWKYLACSLHRLDQWGREEIYCQVV